MGGCLIVEAPGGVGPIDLPGDLAVTAVRATGTERLLAYAALAELCTPLMGHVERLPPVQATALKGALAVGPPSGDALAVATAFRSLLHLAAEEAPLLVVVEDAHLLDLGSSAALAFTARRLGPAAIGVVITQDVRAVERLDVVGAERVILTAGLIPPSSPAEVDLDEAIARARARGSAADLAVAFEALATAASGAARGQALLDAGRAWLDAGRPKRAMSSASVAMTATDDDALTARCELLIGRAATAYGQGAHGAAHLEAAIAGAGDQAPDVAAEARLLLAIRALFSGDVERAGALIQAAQRDLERGGERAAPLLHGLLRAGEAALAMAIGRPADVAPVTGMLAELTSDLGAVADLSLVVATVAMPLTWMERYDEAADLLGRIVDALRAKGANGALPMPLCALAVVERRAGRPTRSLVLAAEAADLARRVGDRGALLFAECELANAHSLFGDVERCRLAANFVLSSGTKGTYRTSALSALATVELWAGDPAIVVELLEPLLGASSLGQSVTLFHPTLITAYAALGRFDDARTLLMRLVDGNPRADRRLSGVIRRCEALLAPAEERDQRFAEAVAAFEGQPLNQGLTRLLYARRLMADGCLGPAAALLHELSSETDENLLGVARAARLSLTRMGLVASTGDPAWARLDLASLEVALASTEGTPALALADRLHLSPPEVEGISRAVMAAMGDSPLAEEPAGRRLSPPAGADDAPRRVEIRLLGGLAILVDGRPVRVPAGAPATLVALVALRRAVHYEEVVDVLWPDVAVEVARRRLRNVLTRVRAAAGAILVREGPRIELAAQVVVDHHELDAQVRRALALPAGPERMALLEAAMDADRGPLLPEVLYEDWADAARSRAEQRSQDLERAVTAARR